MSSTLTYKCPNCDAGLVFDAEKQSFVCEFCISSFTEEQLKGTDSAEKAERAEKENREFTDGVREYHCSSCGAEIITDKDTVADICYYCHNPVVLMDRATGAMKPSKIVPFRLSAEEAAESFLRFAKKKRFVPNDYFAKERTDLIRGIYYPFWVTDADTDAAFEATGHRVRSYRRGNYRITETSHFRIQRRGRVHFEDITTAAISSVDKKMLEGILPYPLNEHTDFSMPYLQGFAAKKRDIEREALSGEVREKMDGYAETLLRGTVGGYSSVTGASSSLEVLSSHWEYTLMPIWMLTYQRKGKTYTYAMNGATGKVYGELPVSIPKLSILFGAVAALAWLISFLISLGVFL